MKLRLLVAEGFGGLAQLADRFGALCEHLGVALLTRPELMAGASRAWEPFNRSPVALSAELFDWERDLYERLLQPGHAALVVGCGAGRELLALLARGLVVDGLDIAPQALARARERVAAAGHASELIEAAMEDAPPLPRSYDLVLFSWFCFSYIPDRGYRQRALAAAIAALRPGGHVAISYIPRCGVGSPTDRAARLAGLVARVAGSGWQPEPGDALLMPGRVATAVFQRQFRPGEAQAEVEQAGLQVIRHELLESGGVIVARPSASGGPAGVTQPTARVDSTTDAP